MELKRINNNIAFGDLAIQSLYKMPKMKRTAIVNAFKTRIGEGLMSKTYTHDGQTFSQDIFIGFIPTTQKKQNSQIDRIIISTGEPLPFEQSISKAAQIDLNIFNKIQKIRDEFKLKNGDYFKGYGYTLGRIRKSNDSVEICMSEQEATWFDNYRKGLDFESGNAPNNGMNNWYIFNKNNGDTFQYSKVIRERE
ncbi:MAG: hypothetical protein WCY19_00905 [Candidatus Gastranaerophilaceae bacterium]